MQKLKEMFDEYNVFAKSFRMTKEIYDNFQTENLTLQLISDREKDGRVYNLPIILEVVAVIIGDASQPINRDIILKKKVDDYKEPMSFMQVTLYYNILSYFLMVKMGTTMTSNIETWMIQIKERETN